MSRTRLALLAASAAMLPATLPVLATAQETLRLDEIVISAGLSPMAESAYGRAVTVLSADEMRERGHVTVEQALRDVPGLSMTSTGETMTKLRMRGSESSHVLVLIDGVEANSPNGGDYTFAGMLTEDIARIEVLRGPQSAIHGANAAAGVVAITTRRAAEQGLHYGGALELGGLGTRAASAFVTARGSRGAISLSAATRRSDGEDASRTPGGDTEFNDRDVLTLSGSYELSDVARAGFTLRRSWQDYGYDTNSWVPVASPDDYVVDAPLTARRDETYGSLWLEAEALDGRLLNRLVLSGMNQDTRHADAGRPTADDGARLRDARFVASWALDGGKARDAAQKLNLAFGRKRESYRSSFAPGGDYARDTDSVALEYQGRFDNGLGLQLGIRRDLNEVFRDATSWSVAGAWQLPDRDLTLRAAVGRAVVNPDMFQQFGFIPGSYRGNPDLGPETSLGYEIGADWGFAQGRGLLGATLFTSRVEDMISGYGPTSVNIDGTSTRKGVELSLDYEASDWLRLGAVYTYVSAREAGGAPVVRQPRHQLGLRARASFAEGRGLVSADLRHVAGSHDQEWFNTAWPDQPATTELPDFTSVNLAAQYDLTDSVALTGRVVNLFDKDYYEAWGYYGQGRTIYAGLSAKW
ncbi:TonB-dependent receptor [Paracoccus sp. (in: a-proteobacteria)]|uniref:TonB-dependent receptor plug domain-containing protein n=1 Tax=Paracoccus sp. TaxID=267 RepID=UPI003220412A